MQVTEAVAGWLKCINGAVACLPSPDVINIHRLLGDYNSVTCVMCRNATSVVHIGQYSV